jgi:hypothetical protein
MKKKHYCILCNNIIFNKLKHSKYCKKCGIYMRKKCMDDYYKKRKNGSKKT